MELNFTLADIAAAAQKILLFTRGQKVFAVHGEMGAGKTTFIHAFCEAAGVTGNISSPTFSIINQYTTIDARIIYHMDLYRLKDETEAISSGVEDCLFSGNICLVEWPEKAIKIFPGDSVHLFISTVDNDTRKLIIHNNSKG